MATIVTQPIAVVSKFEDIVGKIQNLPEAASQSFKKGACVVLSSGKVTASGSDIGGAAIFGIAMADATGTTDAVCPVLVVDNTMVFEANYCGTDGAAKATAVGLYGTSLGLLIDTDGKVKISDTTTGLTACVKVLGLSPKDKLGDTGGRLLFGFLSAKCARNV